MALTFVRSRPGGRPRMSLLGRMKRFAGIDTAQEKYAYAQGPVYGKVLRLAWPTTG